MGDSYGEMVNGGGKNEILYLNSNRMIEKIRLLNVGSLISNIVEKLHSK